MYSDQNIQSLKYSNRLLHKYSTSRMRITLLIDSLTKLDLHYVATLNQLGMFLGMHLLTLMANYEAGKAFNG